jgi:hypothetical protein
MAIMVAGGMTFAVPGMLPAAHAANANLFVSAENSQFDNYMSGPQVIEVVVIDSDINDTDEAKGEPDVTVNGKILRMVQAADGNWYGYFADRDQAQIADYTSQTTGAGLDFGTFCSNSLVITGDAAAGGTISFTDTDGVAIDEPEGSGDDDGDIDGGVITASCGTLANTAGSSTDNQNVLREAKAANAGSSSVQTGQIGVDTGLWPFIQLYEFNPTGNVVVQYNKGGGVQTTTLTFDTVESYADISLDRSVYPQKGQVHATITDLWLNIDPTDEDSWTFGAISTDLSTNYQVFDENGADTTGTVANNAGSDNRLTDKLGDLMCEDNCVLIMNPDSQGIGTDVLTIQDNGDSALNTSTTTAATAKVNTSDLLLGKYPITITEQGPNSGVFGTYDESDKSVLKITDGAKRGTSATLDYNETPTTILVGFDFATIDIQPLTDEWSSGEEIPVIVVDGDANKNSRADEDLDLNDVNVSLIPSLKTGNPVTLQNAKEVEFIDLEGTGDANSNAIEPGTEGVIGTTYTLSTADLGYDGNLGESLTNKVDQFSARAILTDSSSTTVDAVSET